MIARRDTRRFISAAAVGAVLLSTPASAQQGGAAAAGTGSQPAAAPTNIQTALANDVGTLSDKFVGLAMVMAGKYEWRPGPGVRSVGDVFNLIVMENKMLAGLLTGTGAPGGGGMGGGRDKQITEPTELQEALRSSYAALKETLSRLSTADLNGTVNMFGRDTTKQGAALMLIFDQHEHLGQSIAYARSNNVVPPWSK